MLKRYILVTFGIILGMFVGHTVSEILIERYECRRWYNFFNMSIRCHVLKRISHMCESGVLDWFITTKDLWYINSNEFL